MLLARQIASCHGVPVDEVRHGSRQGVATTVLELGAALVLRVSRPGFEVDLKREARVLPLASAVGLPVPDVLDAAVGGRSQHEADPGPTWLLQRRMPGIPLDTPDLEASKLGAAYQDLGRLLRTVASLDVPEHVAVHLPRQAPADPQQVLEDLRDQEWLRTADVRWLRQWFDHLRHWLPETYALTLIHGDASPSNVLIDPVTGRVTALLDWGDTAISDPAVDLAKVRPVHLPAAVRGYAVLDSSTVQDRARLELPWAARALSHHLTWALGRLPTSPRPHDSAWSAPPAARLIGLLRLLTDPPREWTALLP